MARSHNSTLAQLLAALPGQLMPAGMETAARELVTAAASHTRAAAALAAAADALASAADSLAAAAGNWDAGTGTDFISPAFSASVSGLLKRPSTIAGSIGSIIGGKAGAVAGAATAGAIYGAQGAGFGVAGLGTVAGGLLGGALTGGLAAALLFGLPKLFSHGQTPAERAAEIDRILEGQRFSLPEPLEREVGFGQEGFGAVDYGIGNVPRIAPQMQVNVSVSAMDSSSFLDRAPDIADAVRRAMLDMHPINMLVREAY
jgi:hypothetical protein